MLNVHTAFGDPLTPPRPPPPPPNLPTPAGHPLPPHRPHPPPTQLGTGNRELGTPPLLLAILISALRLLVGFAISVLLGMLLGLGMYSSRFLDRLIGPLFLGLQ